MIKPLGRLKKASATFVVLGTSASVAWAACGGTEALVNAAVGKMATGIVASLATAATTIVAADNLQTQQMISGLRVVTKQIQTSTEKYGAAAIASEKAAASVHRDITDKELVDKVVVDFMSQGFDPCGQSAATKKLNAAEVATRNSVGERVRTEVEGVGGRYISVADSLKAREKLHQDMFCTQEEVSAGLCSSLGKVPGGDTNAALIFNSDKSPEMVKAKNAVINNIIGMPDSPLPADVANTPEAQAYMMEKKKKDAFMAFSAYSLKSIQAENEEYKPVMEERIGQFFGTQRATEWAQDQAGQSQRGVIVDLLKLQGLQLKIRERRIRQNMRIEGNLAALLELENQQVNGPVTQAAAQQASAAGAARKVK